MNKLKSILAFILSLALATTVFAQSPPLPTDTLAPMLQKVMPAVVNISAQRQLPAYPSELSPRSPWRGKNGNSGNNGAQLPGAHQHSVESLGSGVIINAENGYILTNAHVVKNSKYIMVTLGDGRRLHAKLLGLDAPSDVAVIQVKAKHLQAISSANSSKLKVGDFVVAIGNPFGLKQSVTSGIISGLQRSNLGIEGYESFIQTDAPINPGNSGGALVNMHGELVGINTAILAPDGGNIGIGFAIPVNMALDVMSQLVKYGKIHRGIMGVLVQNITPDLAKALNLKTTHGAVVSEIKPLSPAAKSGLKVGDVIIKADGEKITSASQVRNIVGLIRIGTSVPLKVMRKGKALNLHVNVINPESYKQLEQKGNPYLYGAIFRSFNVHTTSLGNVFGVQLLNLTQSSPMWRAGLRPGDVLISANNIPTRTSADLEKVAKSLKPDQYMLVHILRLNGAFFATVSRG